jgi:colicin import membrane protein
VAAGALQQDALLPQPTGGNAPGAALALLVHAGLIAALAIGVDWRASSPDVVSAELWAAVPQTAAAPPPPPPEPTPTPAPTPQPVPAPPPPQKAEAPAPDITVEREQRRKAEEAQRLAELKKAEDEKKKRDKLEADKLAQAQAKAQQTAKAAEEKLAAQREENLRRMLAQANTGAPPTATGTAPTGTATTNAAPSASYAGKVRGAIKPNIVFTAERSAAGNAAEVEVNAAPGGSIISRKLLKSSGNREWDEAVLRAIDKTGTLPRDTDGRVPATLIISFRPSD